MSLINTLLFDLDGTLTDPKEGILGCFRHALSRLGWTTLPDDDEISWCIGPPLRMSFAELLRTSDLATIEMAVEFYRERFTKEGKFENKVYAGIPELLSSLSELDLRLIVATSKPEGFANEIIDHFGLRTYFSGVYGSDLEGKLDLKGDLLAHLLKAEKIDHLRCLMIGDRKHDIIAAKANDVVSCGVTWGYGSLEELRQAGADEIVTSPSELLAFVRGGSQRDRTSDDYRHDPERKAAVSPTT